MKSGSITAPLVLLLSMLLGGCGKSMEDLEAWVAEVKARKAAPIEPVPQMKQYEAFTYDPRGKRDPFSMPKPKPAESGPRPDMNRNREPLEEFPLDALRMVGTLRADGIPFALVRAPDGVIHRVTLKHHLGQNYGEIVKIEESQVTLIELVPDGFGGWMERPATLSLTEQSTR